MANSEAEVKVAMRTVVRNLGYIKGIITCKMNLESKLNSDKHVHVSGNDIDEYNVFY